jgi:hypothetical protein
MDTEAAYTRDLIGSVLLFGFCDPDNSRFLVPLKRGDRESVKLGRRLQRYSFRNSSGSFATWAAIRRASSLVSTDGVRPGSCS